MSKKICIIGSGMAGVKLAEKLCKQGQHHSITIFGKETHLPYNRILLSSVLAGEKCLEDIQTHSQEWFLKNNIEYRSRCSIETIDWQNKVLIDQSQRSYEYDDAIIATGSTAFRIPIPGSNHPDVLVFRDMDDITSLMAIDQNKTVAVIGGGLLGLEAAYGLHTRGIKVKVIHLLDHLMEKQLDSKASQLLLSQLSQKGIEFHTSTCSREIVIQNDRIIGIKTKDDQFIAADKIVMAIGIKPRVDLARRSDIPCNRGILVNEFMETQVPNVYALGECVEFDGQTFGLVAPLYDMADTLAKNLSQGDEPAHPYEMQSYPTRLKVSGVDLYVSGSPNADSGDEELILVDETAGIYRKILIHDHKLKGVLLYGNTDHSHWYQSLLVSQDSIETMRNHLVIGPGSHVETSMDISAMADDEEVCGCNGVSKGAIVCAIQEKGLSSLGSVKAVTKAATGCGSCEGLVSGIMQSLNGDHLLEANEETGICPCTPWDHDRIRAYIFNHKMESVTEAFQRMSWINRDGCHKCRPAVNYYLLAANPEGYQDDPQSRFVNERLHANIQKDGTFSVIPRMFGGMTSADELRALADTVDEFNIPTVKVTGGQRIDLLGVKREDLPKVWQKLNQAGMVSGHAYGKAVRTVKTCVGSEWCRFGTQDSTSMGVEIERATWGSWTPHKFKMAVSGCKRNCAEATIKDFGVVAVESGWEIYIGGNGGTKVRACDFLCKVETSDEVMEYTGAFLQLYRENARYLERTAPWIERVGLDWVKDELVHQAANRSTLYDRFQRSQARSQSDPWAELSKSPHPSLQA
ncbi:nitrite reductase large subunit NirB [Pseudobacteriovorax antillogorgiicola]|uniref:Assimilatory nitrite reductase (NAD(P)H) large subunit n=1 Tax=Pseudobacteriovorax antillogorgiicola TaxID=1513793 RepID=A0A1Y6C2G2_9BACT|nr:nitrite reductase large subunit NirB [Pseudobacteriovorax antillogorgiicola]TCS52327.1 assimilatory nitrite reductase (NAD(P)H) large subunit precursor [Pseudobacteriovorax antillogorgiicola]SMF29976.1 assimilatory nitrite reductase (NAD(P)H) large subunit precursor [Pseudobacteriovorax antillogorgiicola]